MQHNFSQFWTVFPSFGREKLGKTGLSQFIPFWTGKTGFGREKPNPGDKPLPEPVLIQSRSLTHICGTRGRWVQPSPEWTPSLLAMWVLGSAVMSPATQPGWQRISYEQYMQSVNRIIMSWFWFMWDDWLYARYLRMCLDVPGHYRDVIMRAMASQITDVSIIYPIVCSGADQGKHQSSASLVHVRGIHRWSVPRTRGQWRGKCFHLMTSSWQPPCWLNYERWSW